jgi:hypothetical protein
MLTGLLLLFKKGSFFLNRGVTCASFSLFGKIPESIDMFIIFVIGDKSDILPSFINLTEILSTPVAFLALNLSMTLDTNVSLVDLN